MSRRRLGRCGLPAMLLLVACSQGRSRVLASSYPQTCARSADCVAVFEGELVGCDPLKHCANATISQDAFAAYAHDVEAAVGTCGLDVSSRCPAGVLTCPIGQCEFHRSDGIEPDTSAARVVSADDYDHACAGVQDCVPIFQGKLGCCEACPNAVIGVASLAQYMTDVDHRAPVCYPATSCRRLPSCPNVGRFACDNGVCALLTASPPDGGSD